MKGWRTHGERVAYDSPWMKVCVADVELPSGGRTDHHLIRVPDSVGTIVVNERGQVLLIWRHRFIADRWGWELPAGVMDPGEDILEAGIRETVEETGLRPIDPQIMCSLYPSVGRSDERAHVLLAHAPSHAEHRSDEDEAPLLAWHDREDLPRLLAGGNITDGFTMCALLWLVVLGMGGTDA